MILAGFFFVSVMGVSSGPLSTNFSFYFMKEAALAAFLSRLLRDLPLN